MTYTHQVPSYKHGPTAKALIAQGWALHVVETYSSKNYTDLLIRIIPAAETLAGLAADEGIRMLKLDRYDINVRVRMDESAPPSIDDAVEYASRCFAKSIHNTLGRYVERLQSVLSRVPVPQEKS